MFPLHFFFSGMPGTAPTDQLIYGLRAIMEAIRSNRPIDKIYLQKGLKGALAQELEILIDSKAIGVSYVPHEKLNKLARGRNHQGALAVMAPIRFHTMEALMEEVETSKDPPIFLLLDGVTDMRNFGAIIRTAECAGVSGVVIQNSGSAPVNEDTVKTSAGAVFRVPISKVAHLKDAIFYLRASDIPVVAATERSYENLYDLDLKGSPVAIIIGSEGRGINPSVLKEVDSRVKIPLMGEIESLNVSVACGIVLYEILRQRDYS